MDVNKNAAVLNRDVFPNAPEALSPKVVEGVIPASRAWGVLVHRSALSFSLLLLMALAYWFWGNETPSNPHLRGGCGLSRLPILPA